MKAEDTNQEAETFRSDLRLVQDERMGHLWLGVKAILVDLYHEKWGKQHQNKTKKIGLFLTLRANKSRRRESGG